MTAPTVDGGSSTRVSTSRALARVRPHRARWHDRAFWRTQALVVGALVVLYGFDVLFHDAGFARGVHDLPVMLFLAPVLYAAIAFGLEGALLTALWCAFLVAPHSVFVARDDLEWVGDIGTLTVITVTGMFLAFRVEKEREARLRAESVSDRLGLLNELATAFDRPMDTAQLLQELVDRLSGSLELDQAWVRYLPHTDESRATLATGGAAGAADPRVETVSTSASRLLASANRPWIAVGDMVVVALIAEGRFLGALGATRASSPLDADETGTLTAAAAQAAVTLENQELQRSRREMLTSYARQVTNAQEDERRRIARELHDGPTQALSGLCRGLDLVQATTGDPEDVVATARSLRSVAEGAVADLRRLARDLRPHVLDDLGLESAVEWLAEDLRERSGLEVRVASTGEMRELTGEEELGVFRIVQEALSNVEKHAAATTVEIALDSEPHGLRVRIVDDGRGFAADAGATDFARQGRYGVLGMQERARLHGGELQVESRPRSGVTVTLEVPWAAGASSPS